MATGVTVPIVRQPWKVNTTLPLFEKQQFNKQKNRSLTNVKATTRSNLRPGLQSWVQVATEQVRIVMIEPYDQFYTNPLCRAGTGFAYVDRNQPFDVLVANFNKHEMDLHPRQGIAYTTQRHEKI